jgi:hypothetical protein
MEMASGRGLTSRGLERFSRFLGGSWKLGLEKGMLVFTNKISKCNRIVTLEEVENVQRISQSGMCRTGRDGSRSSWGLFHYTGRFTTLGCRLGAEERKRLEKESSWRKKAAGERKQLEKESG